MKTKPGPGAPQVFMSPSLITKVREDTGRKENPHALGWILLFMLCCTDNIRQEKKALYYSSTYAGCCLHTPPTP